MCSGIHFSCSSTRPIPGPSRPVPAAISKVNVPLEIPLRTLELILTQATPPQVNLGEKLDFGNGIEGDLFLVKAGMIQLKAIDSDQLEVTLPLQLTGELGLKPGGIRNLFRGKVPINQQLSPVFRVNPQISPNWSIGVSSLEMLDLGGEISLNVLGMRVDLSRFVEQEIQKYIQESLMEKKQVASIKAQVDQLWEQAGKPVVVDFLREKRAFSIRPMEVLVGENLHPQAQTLVLNLGLNGEVIPHPIDGVPSRAFPLPALQPNSNEASELDIQIPLTISYESIDELITQNFEGTGIAINSRMKFIPSNFSSEAFGDQLGVSMDFEAVESGKDPIFGKFLLIGTPTFDPEEKVLAFSEVDFFLESEEKKVQVATQLRKRRIKKQLERKLRFSLAETLDSSISGIQDRLKINTPWVDLGLDSLQIQPKNFYPSPQGLTVFFTASGVMNCSWKSLPE